jgi:hypothetical protein
MICVKQIKRHYAIVAYFILFNFRLVFPFRTFYMYSCTEQETSNWINLINWKLVRLHCINKCYLHTEKL